MATFNTKFQRFSNKWNAIINATGNLLGLGATLQQHQETGGTFVCNGVTPVTVAEPNVGANSAIVITLKTVGGTVSVVPLTIETITPGTGFTVQGQASDTSTYNYLVIG